MGGQHHAPAALPPGKTRYPLYRRLGGPQGRSGRVRKMSTPTGIQSPDRPASSESLYRLSYPGPASSPQHALLTQIIFYCTIFKPLDSQMFKLYFIKGYLIVSISVFVCSIYYLRVCKTRKYKYSIQKYKGNLK